MRQSTGASQRAQAGWLRVGAHAVAVRRARSAGSARRRCRARRRTATRSCRSSRSRGRAGSRAGAPRRRAAPRRSPPPSRTAPLRSARATTTTRSARSAARRARRRHRRHPSRARGQRIRPAAPRSTRDTASSAPSPRAGRSDPARSRLHAQARVLAHGVRGDVVEAPVRLPQRRLALRDRVTQLVKHQLRERVVVIERVRRADRDPPARRSSRTRRSCARRLEADALRGARARSRRSRRWRAGCVSGLSRRDSMRGSSNARMSAVVHFAIASLRCGAALYEIIRHPSCLDG